MEKEPCGSVTKGLLERIRGIRGNRAVIAYVLADRPQGVPAAQVGADVIRPFYEHLETIGPAQGLDLFLYTRGGQIVPPLRLVHLLREYCEHLAVLVPFRAHSAGTLIALGADEIVMGRMGELSPIDPRVALGPDRPTQDQEGAPAQQIEIEDLSAYFRFAQDVGGLTDSNDMAAAFGALVERVSPLQLGHLARVHSLIRLLGRRLLATHMPANRSEELDQIVRMLTEGYFSHEYLISRQEAENIPGLKVVHADEGLERAMWRLYEAYEQALGISLLPDWNAILGGREQARTLLPSGAIESIPLCHHFQYEAVLSREGEGVHVDIQSFGWNATSDD